MALTSAERQARYRRARERDLREAGRRIRRLEDELASLRADVALYIKAGEVLKEAGIIEPQVADALTRVLGDDGVPTRERP